MKKLITAASIGFLILFSALPALASTQTFNRNLYYGLTNDTGVLALQQFLAAQGDYSGAITGNFFRSRGRRSCSFSRTTASLRRRDISGRLPVLPQTNFSRSKVVPLLKNKAVLPLNQQATYRRNKTAHQRNRPQRQTLHSLSK
jgi:hypothetical protein